MKNNYLDKQICTTAWGKVAARVVMFLLILTAGLLGSVQTAWAEEDNDYYFRASDDNWNNARKMTLSADGYYYYYPHNWNEINFKITKGSDWNFAYGKDCVQAQFNGTTVSGIGQESEESTNARKWESVGDYYFIVYKPNTVINTTNTPIICASTTLPRNNAFVAPEEGAVLYFLMTGEGEYNWWNNSGCYHYARVIGENGTSDKFVHLYNIDDPTSSASTGREKLFFCTVSAGQYKQIDLYRGKTEDTMSDNNSDYHNKVSSHVLTLASVNNKFGTVYNANFGDWQSWSQYQMTSTASLSAEATAVPNTPVTLTPALTSNQTFNTIKSVSYTISPVTGASITDNTFTATVEGEYTITASITYNAKGFPDITKTAETTSVTISVSNPNTYYNIALGSEGSYTGGSATITSSGSMLAGTSITATATATTGYQFVAWYNNADYTGDQLSTEASYTFNASRDITLYAKFRDQHITYSAPSNYVWEATNPAHKNAGEEVSFTVTANDGYYISNIAVTKAGGEAVEYTRTGNSYSFTMPEGAVTISATATAGQMTKLYILAHENYSNDMYVYVWQQANGCEAYLGDGNNALTHIATVGTKHLYYIEFMGNCMFIARHGTDSNWDGQCTGDLEIETGEIKYLDIKDISTKTTTGGQLVNYAPLSLSSSKGTPAYVQGREYNLASLFTNTPAGSLASSLSSAVTYTYSVTSPIGTRAELTDTEAAAWTPEESGDYTVNVLAHIGTKTTGGGDYETAQAPAEGAFTVPVAASYAITVTPNDKVEVTVSYAAAAKDEAITITATPAEHYTVSEVKVNNGAVTTTAQNGNTYTFTMPDQAVTITTVATPIPYTITYSNNGKTTTTTDTNADGVTLPTLTCDHYNFEGWYTNDNYTNKVGDGGANYKPTANITLYAKWTEKTHTVTLVGEHGTLKVGDSNYSAPVTVGEVTTTTIKAEPAICYEFVNWTVTSGNASDVTFDDASAAETTITTNADVTITANFRWTGNTNYYLLGFGEWTTGENIVEDRRFTVAEDGSTVARVNITLDAYTEYKAGANTNGFKLYSANSKKLYGCNGTMQSSECTSWQFYDGDDNKNCGIKTEVGGEYVFELDLNNLSEHRISVVYPEAQLTLTKDKETIVLEEDFTVTATTTDLEGAASYKFFTRKSGSTYTFTEVPAEQVTDNQATLSHTESGNYYIYAVAYNSENAPIGYSAPMEYTISNAKYIYFKKDWNALSLFKQGDQANYWPGSSITSTSPIVSQIVNGETVEYYKVRVDNTWGWFILNNNNGSQTGNIAPANVEANHHYKYSGNKLLPDDEDDMCVFYIINEHGTWKGQNVYFYECANDGNSIWTENPITKENCVYPVSIHKGSQFQMHNNKGDNNNDTEYKTQLKSYDASMNDRYYYYKYSNSHDNYQYEPITFSLGLSSTPNIPASGNTITLTLTPLTTSPTSILNILREGSCLNYKYYVSANGGEYTVFIPEENGNTKTYTLPTGTLQENDRYSFKVEACAGDRVLATTEPVVVTVEATQKTFYFINNKKWDAVYLTRSSHKQPGKYIYTLVGDQTWLSKSWDNNNVDAEMYCTDAPIVDEATDAKTYTFTRTRKNVKLEYNKPYECKVITGHDYNGYQYPGDGTGNNHTYTHNGETGYYDLTFTFIVTENNVGNNETEVITVAENPLTVTATRCENQEAAAAEGAYTIAGAVQVHQDAARCDLYKIDIFHGETFYLTDTKGKQKTAKEQFTDVNHYQVYRYSLDNKKLVDIDMQVSPQSTVVNNAVTLKANVPDANECIKYKFYYRQGAIDKTATYTAINNEPSTAISALHTPSATGKWSYKMEVYTKNSAAEFVHSTTDYEEINVQESTDITFFFYDEGGMLKSTTVDGAENGAPQEGVFLYVYTGNAGTNGNGWKNANYPGVKLIPQMGENLYEITLPRNCQLIINNSVTDNDKKAKKRQTVDISPNTNIGMYNCTLSDGHTYKLHETSSSDVDGKRYQLEEITGEAAPTFYRVRTVNSQGIYFSNWVANTGTTEGGNRISGDTLSFFVEKGGRIEVFAATNSTSSVTTTTYNGESGVKTAVLNANKEVTEIAAYPREWGYFINVDAAKDQRGYQMNWAEMSPEAAADAKFTYFPPNDNYPNEYFNHYWIRYITKDYCVNATVGNRFNGLLSDAIIPETSKTNGDGYPAEHANVRFGYHDETNKFTRVFLTGAPLEENNGQLTANNNVFLRLYGDNIYYDENRTNKIDKLEAFKTDKVNGIAPANNRFKDMSNWTYEFEGYADPNSSVKIIAAYPNPTALTSFFGQDELGNYYSQKVLSEDATALAKPIKIRFIYDFKTNRLITAWNPQDAEIDKAITIDAPMMITREQGVDDASTTTTKVSLVKPEGTDTRYGSVNDLKQVYATFEISKVAFQGNQTGKMFWMSLPFDCRVGDVFGLDGYGGTEGKKWVIQRYGGDWRAHYGYQSWIETFWMNLDETYNTSTLKYEDHILPAGEGFVLNLFGVTADDFKEGADGQSILRIYFPSTSSKSWNLTMSGDGWTKEYPRMICKVDGRKKYDSNWRVIGVLGYDDITMTDVEPSFVEKEDGEGNTWVYDENNPLRYYYAWSWNGTEGVYTPTTWEIEKSSMRTMYGYMAQFAGTINWSRLANTEDLPASVRARDRREFQGGRVRIDLMQGDNSLDRTYIQLVEGATAEFDENIDLNKVAKPDSYIYTYGTDLESILPTDWRSYYADQSGNPIGTGTTLWDMQAYAANCLPVEDAIIPLAVNVKTEGSYTFKAQSVPEGMTCILHDTVANLRVNMALDSYTVDNLQVGDITDRFAIEITIAETPSIPDNLENANAETIHYWQQDGSLYFSGLNANERFVLYDMVGHVIYSGNYQLGQAIPAPQTGMYLFSTHTATVKITVR